MDKETREFLRQGEAGRPVYTSLVRQRYNDLPQDESFRLGIVIALAEGGRKIFSLRLPRFFSCAADGQAFVEEFFLAVVYNIISCVGGRRIWLVNHDHVEEGAHLHLLCESRFGLSLPRSQRPGYGRSVNVAERVVQALQRDGNEDALFVIELVDAPPAAERQPAHSKWFRSAAAVYADAASDLAGKTILGIDIGGTDIKLAMAIDGRLALCKEFDWDPASFTTIDQFLDPLHALVQVMGIAAGMEQSPAPGALTGIMAPGLKREADIACMRNALEQAKKAGAVPVPFNAIGLCFPDVVVNNKVVGGESPKTLCVREAFGLDFDREYVRLTHVDRELRPYVTPDGCVGIVNDGTIAAFTMGVETAVCQPEMVARGVLAHSLGTDFGSGWVDETGGVPRIPLEMYNCIIDLGSRPERAYPQDDVRSVNNFTTALPGTAQKYASQNGVFRLAAKYFPHERPESMQDLFARGFLIEEERNGAVGIFVSTSPQDMRKPLLEHVMALAEQGDAVAERIFREVGEALAAVSDEIDWILNPAARERMLFGRLVKKPACFALMQQGAAKLGRAGLTVADGDMAETPIMQALDRSREYTVAQFAQAVGAIYYGNYCLASVGFGS